MWQFSLLVLGFLFILRLMLLKEVKNNFRVRVLQDLFATQAALHPHYSLRRFAQHLGIEASTLSQHLKGKRPISNKSFQYLCKTAGLATKEIQQAFERFLKDEDKKYLLPEEYSEITRHWYYFAILELCACDDFQSDAVWIAKKLNIPLAVCQRAIDKLFVFEALTIQNGKWIDGFANVTFIESEDMDTVHGRAFQTQLLNLAQSSVEKVSGVDKSHTSIMTALDADLIPEIKIKIKNFRREILTYATEHSKKKDALYNLQINFHPLTVRK